MPVIANSVYLKKKLPTVEYGVSGGKQLFTMYENAPPDKLIALLKENKFEIRVSGYASEEQWEGYKLEIVNLQKADHDKNAVFLFHNSNLFIKGYNLPRGEINIVFYVDNENPEG